MCEAFELIFSCRENTRLKVLIQLATTLTAGVQSSRLGGQVSGLQSKLDSGLTEISVRLSAQREIIAESRSYIGEV